MQQQKIIKIAQIMGQMNSGGVESFVMNYYRRIDRNNIQFEFIVDDDSIVPQKCEIEQLGGKIYYIPNYKHLFKYIRSIYKIFKENEYNIVHSHLNSLSVFPLFAAWLAKIPIRIAHSHSTTSKKELKRNIVKLFLKNFSKIFATNYFACSEHAAIWLFGKKTFYSNKVDIIRNAIDIKRFEYNENKRILIRKSIGEEKSFLIGHVGRFVPQKNHEFIIDVFDLVHKKVPFSSLVLIGEGPLENSIRKKVCELNLENCVHFVGTVDQVENYMSALDCFVFPSIYEGLGIVAIEAQANNLPILCSQYVPDEANITNTITYINLNDKNEWIKTIISLTGRKRTKDKRVEELITKKGYNITCEAKKLEEKYKALINF